MIVARRCFIKYGNWGAESCLHHIDSYVDLKTTRLFGGFFATIVWTAIYFFTSFSLAILYVTFLKGNTLNVYVFLAIIALCLLFYVSTVRERKKVEFYEALDGTVD
jgi:O-antigen ligase